MKRVLSLSCVLAVLLVGCQKNEPVAAGPSAPATGQFKPTRLNIKHATDADAANISLAVKDTTIDDMQKEKPPANLDENKRAPFEKTVWQVDATVKTIQTRKDGDYYLVIESPTGKQSVVEVPDPKLCKGSPLLSQITATRKALEDKFHPTADPQAVNQEAKIQGVGFYGGKGKNGGSSNGSRLMPGLGFDWKKKS